MTLGDTARRGASTEAGRGADSGGTARTQGPRPPTSESWWVDADATLDTWRGREGEPVESVAKAGDRYLLLGLLEIGASGLDLGGAGRCVPCDPTSSGSP